MSLRLKLALTIVVAAVPLLLAFDWLKAELEQRQFESRVESFVDTIMAFGGSERLARSPESWSIRMFGRGGRRGDRRGRGGRPRERDARARDREMRERGARPGDRETRERGENGRRRGWPRGRPPSGLFEIMRGWRRAPIQGAMIWAYGADLTSENPKAPPFPEDLRRAMAASDRIACVATEQPPRPERRERPPDGEQFKDNGPPLEEAPRREGVQCALPWVSDDGTKHVLLISGDRLLRPDPYWWIPLALCGCLVLTVLFAAGPMVGRIGKLTDEVKRSASGRYETPVGARGRDEIAKLAEAFNEAGVEIRSHLEDIEARERTLREFIGNTTHDVMIPLTVLQGHLTTIRRKLEAGDRPEPEVLASALNEAHYMGSILHNLSAAAKLEGADLELRNDPVPLGDVVERAVSRHRTIARSRGVDLDFAVPEHPVIVRGDVTLIEQAVSNVIHNGVRYNNRGGHVAVLLANGDTRFSLRVIDDGPGIAEEELARLPERRFRGEKARTRVPDGLGLGLHIARDVARRHGFDIAFRRSEYGGLEVEFTGNLYKSV